MNVGKLETRTHGERTREESLTNSKAPIPTGGDCFVNSLPFELLSHIFKVGSMDDKADSGFSLQFLILVSHVCQHWRNVAISTPSLWTTIAVPPLARPPYEVESMQLWRSNSFPIDIHVKCNFYSERSRGDSRSLFTLLTPHVHRWGTMEISTPLYDHIYEFLDAVSGRSFPAASRLTTLKLYHDAAAGNMFRFPYPRMSKQFTLFSGSAPLLTTLVLWGVHVDWDQPWIASASNLRSLELANHAEDVRPSWTQLSKILQGASGLEKLGLRRSGPSGDPPGWFIKPASEDSTDLNAPVQLLRVKEFVFTFHSETHAIGLLSKLHLPALRHLHLDFFEDDLDDDYTNFIQELARPTTYQTSGQEQPRSLLSNLESLKIFGLPCRDEGVEVLYGGLQNLTSLYISLSKCHLSFLRTLRFPPWWARTPPERGSNWLPRLATLYIVGTHGKFIRELVSQRMEAGVPLSSLYVDRQSRLDGADKDWLKKNVNTFDFFDESYNADADYDRNGSEEETEEGFEEYFYDDVEFFYPAFGDVEYDSDPPYPPGP